MSNRKMIYLDDAIEALERKKDKTAKGDIAGFYNKIIQNDIDALMQLPSAQFKRINKETHEITESDKISYAVICDKFPVPCVYFDTYDSAEHWAKIDQPNYRPFYIVKRSEHFEIVGKVR